MKGIAAAVSVGDFQAAVAGDADDGFSITSALAKGKAAAGQIVLWAKKRAGLAGAALDATGSRLLPER